MKYTLTSVLREATFEVGGVYHQEFRDGLRVYFKAVSRLKLPFWKKTPSEEVPATLK